MCLHNEPTKHIEKGYCGDYIVNGEDGEECDCGNEATCDDSCCHASNCSLVTGGMINPSSNQNPSQLI